MRNRFVETAVRQLRRAARRFVRAPLFSVTAALTLTLGIGATTAVFSLVEGVLLRPLPFEHPEQLVDVSHTLVVQGITHVDQSDATYLYYRQANHVFSGVGAYQPTAVNLSASNSGDAAHAQRVQAARVSASTFRVLGVAPLRGRFLYDAEDLPSATPVVVLSEQLWRQQYASDPGVIGSTVMIGGVAHRVVGVMPARFTFPDDRTNLWLPIGIDPARTESASFDYKVVARLRQGVTIGAAQADLMALLPKVPEAYPGRLTAPAIAMTKMRPVVQTFRDSVVGTVGRPLWIIFAAAAFLLLIACANVANLFLIRAEERQHDLMVRRALGAGRSVILAEFLSEAILVAGLGGVLGVVLADAAIRALESMQAGVSIPRLSGVNINGTVLLVTLAATAATALIMSLVPALRSNKANVAMTLGQSGRSATAGRSRHRARRAFVVVQVALALVLVTGAGLMARSFASLRTVTPGFQPADAYTFRIAMPDAAYPSTSEAVGLVSRALDRLASVPGVSSAGAISKLPLDVEARQDSGVWVEDRPLAPRALPNVHQVAFASPNAFKALGVPLIQGHSFDQIDPTRATMQAVVTRALARRYWGDSLATGRQIGFSPEGPWFTVVGVTGDIRGDGLDQPPDETVYLPLVVQLAGGMTATAGRTSTALWTPRNVAFVVRGSGSAMDVGANAARELRALAPALPVYRARDLADVIAAATARTSFTLQLLELASIAALLIGAVGLYGVVSYGVSLRGKELAVRLALGAEPDALRKQVLLQALAVSAVGIVLGLGAAVLLTRFLAAMLYGVTPTDPLTLGGAVVIMLCVAIVASWLPARRAALAAPADALRADV